MGTFEEYLARQQRKAEGEALAAYRKHRRNCKTREERKLTRNINIGAAAFAVFMVCMAYLALQATFGW